MSELFKGKPVEYYEGLDKRTTEYKEFKTWKKLKDTPVNEPIEIPTNGAGDMVEAVTKATGIKKAVEFLFGENCGCEQRRQKMNSKLGYFSKRRGNPLEAWEYEFLVAEYFNLPQGQKRTREQEETMQQIYNRVFNESRNKRFTTCGSCQEGMRKNLKKVLEYYDTELEESN